MSLPEVVSRDEWLAARKELLTREKELTRRRDAVNADRRRLPMVRVDKDYAFEGPSGRVGLLDLFDGLRQLVVYHAMFDPAWENACPGCTAGMDEWSPGQQAHLRSRETNYVRVSRAPYPKLAAYAAPRGWQFPWYSSYGSDFNEDFHATVDGSEVAGYSCFLRDGTAVFHTYSTFGRGTEQTGDAYGLLDLTALGRQEDWEEPKGRVTHPHGADPTFR